MPQQTKIFRVFVSSTFTDMKEERRLLQKNVFPKLEQFCEENGAKFQAVDLRWGVSEESQLNQKTLDICLNEISRCQKISPKPNFLILLGNKYGWQPLPSKIPEEELKDILKILKQDEKEVIDRWYRLDENAIPTEYILKPRGTEYISYNDWEKVERITRTILRNAVSNLNFHDKQKTKYFTSATHQEITMGALNPPTGTEKPAEHVLALIRETENFPHDKLANGFIDLVNGEADDYSEKQLSDLKRELKIELSDNYAEYSARWTKGKTTIDNSTKFELDVYHFLESIIKQQLKEVINPDEIEHEVKLHREFKEKLIEHFSGRQNILNRIKLYLTEVSDGEIMSIIGESGSGKTSVMAMAIDEYENIDNNALIVYRFIGTTSNSSNIISLLRSICGEIAKEFGETLDSLAGEGKENSMHEITGMMEIFEKCLDLGNEQKPIIIFLDALDQLSEIDTSNSISWLPKELSKHTKIVVSSLPNLQEILSATYIEHLPILPEKEAKQIINKWFHSINRKLTIDQYDEVIKKFNQNGLAVYLKLAFEKAKKLYSYETNFTLNSDVNGMFNDFMMGLEEEHGKEFVENVLCYMLSGKYQGLTENEILEILVFDKEYWKIFLNRTHPEHRKELKGVSKIPIVVWSRLFLDLEPYLTERDADGVPIITFFHRQFIEILRERYNLDDC